MWWNDNCVFCHNVVFDFGLDFEIGCFMIEVVEFGIGCEVCYGLGSEYVVRNFDFLWRYVLHVGDVSDLTIVSFVRFELVWCVDVCGCCYG